LPATRDAQTRQRLQQLIKQYEETRTQASAVLGNLQGLVAARDAQVPPSCNDSEPLRTGLEAIVQRALADAGGIGMLSLLGTWWRWRWVLVAGGLRPSCGCTCRPDSALQVAEAQRLGSRAARSRRPSGSTTPTRRRFCA
jgi:hypothetical protein